MKLMNLIILIMLLILGACRESKIDPNTNPAFDSTPTSIVNHPPTIDALTDEIVSEGSAITTIDLADGSDDFDFDNEPLTYTCFFDRTDNDALDSSSANCSSLPGLITFDSHTGVLNWTPDYTASGKYEIWFTATDGSLFDLRNVLITVLTTNQPPKLDALTATIATAGGSAITPINLSDNGDDLDADGDSITYSCDICLTLPGTKSFDTSTGIFNWTPTYSAAGTYSVTFTATDGSLTDSKQIQFTVSATNRAPTLDSLPTSITGAEGSAINTINLADDGDDLDIDGNVLTYSCNICSTLPGTKSFNSSTGIFDWTPDYTAAGIYTITFTATDGSLTDSKQVQFTITGTNQSPKINTLAASISVSEGSAVTAIDLTDGTDDFDADGDAITYSCLFELSMNNMFDGPGTNCTSLPGSVSFSASTGVFNWTPHFNASGTYEVWFTATDGSLTDSKHIQFTVTNTNRSPVLDTLVATISGPEGVALTSIDLSDSGDDLDIDGDLITYSCMYGTTNCDSLPGTTSFNTATGVFAWTPDYAASGIYEISFKATDSYGASSAASKVVYTITNVNPLPSFAITGVTGGSDVTLDARLDFVMNPTINWQSSVGAETYDVVVYENNGTTVACTAATGLTTTSHTFAGCSLSRGTDYKARVTAKNSSGASQTASNDLYTFRVNSNPIAVNDGPYYIVAGGNITVNVLANNLATSANDPDSDPEGDSLSITAKTNGTRGNANISGTSIVYSGLSGQTGMDTFTYTISDNKGGTATGTVTIYIISGFTWIGAVNSDWSNTGNWCGSINATKTSCSGGASLPTTTSNVQFNSACINCNVNIDVPVDIARFTMDADFPGTISQNATVNVRTSWTQNGGTFNGGSTDLTVSSLFTLNGGTFKSTSGIFKFTRNQGCCGFASDSFNIGSSATFNHNNGTVYLYGETSNPDGGNVGSLQINTPNVTFYNLTFDGADTHAGGGYNNTIISFKSGITITVLNLVKQIDGKIVMGTINLLGNAEFTCTSVSVCSENGGQASYLSTDIQFNAPMPMVQKLISVGGGRAPSVTISGTGTVDVVSDTNDLWIVGNFKQVSGVFNAPTGWLRVHPASANCCSGNTEGFRLLGGVFNGNGVSLYLSGHNGNSASGTPTVGTLLVPLGFTVRNFHYDNAYYSTGTKWDLGVNIIYVEEDFVHSDGLIAGTPHFIVYGDVSFTCSTDLICAERSNVKITFEGNATQVVSVAPGAGISTNTWTINKPLTAGSFVSLNSHLILNGVNQDLTIESGVLAMNGYNLTVRDTPTGNNNVLTLAPNTLIDRGSIPGLIDAELLVKDASAVITP